MSSQSTSSTRAATAKKPRSPDERLGQQLHALEARLDRVRDELARTLVCSTDQAGLLISALPGSLRIGVDLARLQTLQSVSPATRPAHHQILAAQLLSDIEKKVEQIETTGAHWLTNPDRARRRLQQLLVLDAGDDQTSDLSERIVRAAERRAILRAYTHRARKRIDTAASPSLRERALRSRLERFLPLDDFPHRVTEVADLEALEALLQELEPVFTEIKPELDALPEVSEPVPTTVLPVEDEPVELVDDDPWDDQVEVDVTIPTQTTDAFVEHTPTFTTTELPEWESDIPTTKERPELSLGECTLQRGDTFYDLILGQTLIGLLPILQQLSTDQISHIAEISYQFLEANPNLRYQVGFATSLDEVGIDSLRTPTIQLDLLSDIVVWLAANEGLVAIERRVLQTLRRRLEKLNREPLSDRVRAPVGVEPVVINSLSDLWPALQDYLGMGTEQISTPTTTAALSPYTPRLQADGVALVRISSDNLARLEQVLVDTVYDGAVTAYEADFQDWTQHALANEKTRAGQPILVVLAPLSLPVVERLLRPSVDLDRWLRLHQIEPNDWRVWVRRLKVWRRLLREQQQWSDNLFISDVLRRVYALEQLQARRR